VDYDEINELNATFKTNLSIVLSTGRCEPEWISAVATASCIASLSGGLVVEYSTGNQYFADDAVKLAKAGASKIE